MPSSGSARSVTTLSVARLRATSSDAAPEPQALLDHLRQTAVLAEAFASKAGLPLAGRYMGLWHDLGKYAPLFQHYLLSAHGCISPDSPEYCDFVAMKGKIDHSTAGAQRVWRRFARKAAHQPLAQMLAVCMAGHHSGLADCITPEGEDAFLARMNKDDAKTHLSTCLERAEEVLLHADKTFPLSDMLREIHAALYALRQRRVQALPPGASAVEQADNENSADFQQGLLARFLLSCLLDADCLDSAGFDDPIWKARYERAPRRPWERLVPRLEAHLAGLAPRYEIDALRRRIADRCAERAADAPGLFTLTVPTGGGKTLSSLRFALHHARQHGMDRIIYVIPYTSIIDQNAEVARRILEEDEEPGSIVLEHHSNLAPRADADGKEDAASPWEKLAENWDAPVVFTTMVQFLESLFGSGTRTARRMHNLARAVIIFDEIQTLPVRCVHMFCNALDFLIHTCASSAVLCTATQPCLDRVRRPLRGSLRLDPHREIMDNVPELFARLRRNTFFCHDGAGMDSEAVAALALKELALCGSCLVVCNTKSWAEKVYAHCARQSDLLPCYLSTHLCPAHRLEKIDALRTALAAGQPVLCVSTQLIECGVDISFGSVIRLAAGLDSILQAAGRCNRHGGPTRGRVHIVTTAPGLENLDSLPDIRNGRAVFLGAIRVGFEASLRAWENDFTRPELVQAYFEHYFYSTGTNMAYHVNNGEQDDTLLSMLGSNVNAQKSPSPFMLHQSFASAARRFNVIDAPTQAVIVPYGQGAEIIAELCSTSLFHQRRELLRRAQRYSVNLFPHTLATLLRQDAVHDIQQSGILTLRESFYSCNLGVITRPEANMSLCYFGQED